MSIEHGTGLRVDDGDLVLTGGRLGLVSGLANLAQALTLRVLTPLGSDRYDVRYGLDAHAIFTGPHGGATVRDLIRLNLVRTLGSDPRVRDIREIRVTEPTAGTDRRAWRVDVSIVAADGSPAMLALDLGGQQ